MYEPVTIERLNNYTEIVGELDNLLRRKEKIIKKLKTLQGVDYSKIKVTTGNAIQPSIPERYTLALEEVNSEINQYKGWLVPEHEIIKRQIAKIKNRNYRKLLVYRYLEKWKWSEIVQYFFEFEEDFEAEKNGKYKDTLMYWNRRALEELAKISTKPLKE